MTPGRHIKALLSLDRLAYRRPKGAERQWQVHHRRVITRGAYRVSVLFQFSKAGQGRFVVRLNDTFIADFPASDRQRFASYLVQVTGPGDLKIDYENVNGRSPTILGVGIRKVADLAKIDQFSVQENDICASMATYPARQHTLREAIESLLPQVDHLFIYLNHYRYVPDYFLSYDVDKFHYILDTDSNLRSSAKFYWLQRHKCFWLTCDDDIIYPRDYVRRLKNAHEELGGKAVVGVHGTVFDPVFSEYYSSRRHDFAFAQKVERTRQVHMLGTGTLLLHSSQLEKDDVDQLLSHPTENDEIFALICRRRSTSQYAVERLDGWMKSNPKMMHGLYEETMLNPVQQARLTSLLKQGNPWPNLAAGS